MGLISCHIHLLKMSLTVLVFVSFLFMLMLSLLERKKYLIMWSAGLGLAFISRILVMSITCSYNFTVVSLGQKVANVLVTILMFKGCMYLLSKKNEYWILFFSCITIAIQIFYALDIIPESYATITYFLLLTYINFYVLIKFIKSTKSLIFNKYIIASIFFIMGLLNIFNCFIRKHSVYQLLSDFIIFLIILFFYNYAAFVLYKNKINLLYEKEACFDDNFNYSRNGLLLMTIDGKIIRTNETICEIMGYSDEELRKLKIQDINCMDDIEDILININELLLEKKRSYQVEKKCVNKQGRIIWAILTISLIRDRKNKPMYIIVQVQDITSYKNLQEDLIISNEKYKTLLNSYNNSIAVYDKEYRYVVANQYVVDRINENIGTNFKTDTIIGVRVTDIYRDIWRTEIFTAAEYVMKNKISKNIITNYRTSKGDIRWYEFHISPVPEGILMITNDITYRIEAQQTIIEKELKYRNLVEQALEGIMLVDKDGYLIEFNQEMQRITGIKKAEVLNKPIWDVHFKIVQSELKNEERYNKVKKAFKSRINSNACGRSGKVKTGVLQRRDGTLVTIEEFCYTIITENTRMICYICRDITELKNLERIKEKAVENERLLKETIEMEKLRTEFFANLSHEFRTPLNIIMSSNKMLYDLMDKQDNLSKECAVKYLSASKQNCYRLLRLINNIIDITKIDSGFLYSNFTCQNIVSIVEDISQSIVDYAKNKGISIIFDTDIEEKYILCDVDMIERIILNLLSNAIKFTEAGGKIEISLFDKNKSIEIRVKDNGIGISQDKLSLIFERFRQVDKSLTRKQEGSGIGLSLVKSLVEMHKGKIEVLSTLGKGTTFIVNFPTCSSNICNEVAATRELSDSKVEKVNIEFSDIYF